MCLSHFLWDFVGTNINIFFEFLGLKGAVSMGPPRPALTFFRDEPRFKSPTLNYAHPASPHFLWDFVESPKHGLWCLFATPNKNIIVEVME